MNSLFLRTLLISSVVFISACSKNDGSEGSSTKHDEKGHKHSANEKQEQGKGKAEHNHKEGEKHQQGEDSGHKKDKPKNNASAGHKKDDGHNHGSSKEKGKKGDGHDHKEEEEENVVKLNTKKRKLAGILTLALNNNNISEQFSTTGEVKIDSYASANITTRIQAQVVKRIVKRGATVKKNQPMVVLSSVQMAEAQAGLLLAEQEWRRVKILGKSVVSARRINEAKIKYQLAFAKVQAFGMTQKQIMTLLKTKDAKNANGTFTLISTIDGTVIHDKFIEGEVIEPGKLLYRITNESKVWVEAHVKPEQIKKLKVGTVAKVKAKSNTVGAKIIQLPHMVDEKTRTIPVRLSVDNKNDDLHAGEFVTVTFVSEPTKNNENIRVPTAAVVRNAKGKWRVFVEKAPNQFSPVNVVIVKNDGDDVLIKGSLSDNTSIVVKGAFFLQSELSKSGFHVHNH